MEAILEDLGRQDGLELDAYRIRYMDWARGIWRRFDKLHFARLVDRFRTGIRSKPR